MQTISRRSFVRGLGAGTVGLFAASLIAEGPRDAAAAPLVAPLAQVQPKTARLVYATPAPSGEGNNPNREIPPNDSFQLKPMYENLIGSDPQSGNWIPMLAESWGLEPDGRSVRFRLRRGVQFHNGFGEFTARDVAFTFQDLTQPPGAINGGAGLLREVIDGVDVINDYEVVFRANRTDYGMLEVFGYGGVGLEIKSKADYDARGLAPGQGLAITSMPLAGTGPYQFIARAPGQYVRFARVPYQHWRVQPDFQELELRYLAEDATRLAALLTGEVHVAAMTQDLMQTATSRGAIIVPSSVAGNQVAFNIMGAYLKDPEGSDELLYPNSPVNDVRVRRALNKAIDRDAINSAFYGGKGEPLYLMGRNPSYPGWDPQFETRFADMYGYDPQAARALLADAGYGPGGAPIRVTVLAQGVDPVAEAAPVMEAVASMFQAVGIDAPILSLDQVQHRARREALSFTSAIEFNSSASEPITAFKVTNTTLDDARGQAVERREIVDLYRRVIATLDPAVQEPLWRQLGVMSYEMFQLIPIVRTRLELVADPRVVASYTFPGAQVTTPYTHVEYIRAA